MIVKSKKDMDKQKNVYPYPDEFAGNISIYITLLGKAVFVGCLPQEVCLTKYEYESKKKFNFFKFINIS